MQNHYDLEVSTETFSRVISAHGSSLSLALKSLKAQPPP